MKNSNFINKYSTEKSQEELERENSIKIDVIAKKVCDYWKSRMLSKTTLDLTEKEKNTIQEFFQEIEIIIKDQLAQLPLGECIAIDDFKIINGINRKINSGILERDIMSYIDHLTGAEIEMEFSKDHILLINRRPPLKNTSNGYIPWYEIEIGENESRDVYEYLYCTPNYIRNEQEVIEKLEKSGFVWAKNKLEALKQYEKKSIPLKEIDD